MRRIFIAFVLVGAALVALLLTAQTTGASTSPLNLSNTPDDSRNPAIAVATNGARHVVWEETVAISPTLSLTYLQHRFWNGSSWSSSVTVSTGTRAALAVGPDFNVHLAWTDEFDNAIRVFYSNWNGASWSAPQLIVPGLSGDATDPAIVVDGANTVRVAWGQFDAGAYKIYYATSASGGAGVWSSGPVFNANGYAPALALDGSGGLYMAWHEGLFGAREIYYATLISATWSLSENVSQTASGDSLMPAIALAPGNQPLIAWSEDLSGQLDAHSSIRGAANWLSLANISNSPTADSSRPRLGRAQNDLIVAWNESATPAGIKWAFGRAGRWTSPVTLVSGGGSWGGVAVDSAGDGIVHTVYDGGATANGDVFYTSFNLLHVHLPLIAR